MKTSVVVPDVPPESERPIIAESDGVLIATP